jgi:hypothetical protein
MTVNQLIEKLQGIKEAEGGDIEVFLCVEENEGRARVAHVGQAEHLVDEEVFQGHCEDYHQCVLIE